MGRKEKEKTFDPEDIKYFNEVALGIGPTPIYDDNGILIPIGQPEGKGKRCKVYVVWRGRCIGIFFSWGTVVCMIGGYRNNAFKSYKTLEEAYAGWVNGPGHAPGHSWTAPAIRDPIFTHPELYGVPTPLNSTPATFNTSPAPPSPRSSPSPAPSSPSSSASSSTFVSAPSSPANSPPRKLAPTSQYDPVNWDAMSRIGSSTPSNTHSIALPASSRVRRPVPPPLSTASGSRSKSTQDVPKSSDTPRTNTRSLATTTTSSIVVSEGRAYAVVRGDVPGVYLDKSTAYLLAGNHPGRCVKVFKTLRAAQDFYDDEELEGRVGVPVLPEELEDSVGASS
ncbi:hypothetical protein OH76DRAFT_1490000 [Lentinus brumalis]|uniref:Ribonuclease H1 N-terminal domain-containing protein n=1 Tax=Lentinus brumalis TaxID=2498619 RepID=A0A371CKH6_9APHY|nr:hypothetical protein OH76DRAFT_1490000 [Polyporus brumalis]